MTSQVTAAASGVQSGLQQQQMDNLVEMQTGQNIQQSVQPSHSQQSGGNVGGSSVAVNNQVSSAHASLYVGDLDEEITEALIYEKFSRIGTIVSIRVCRDMISRKGLGYAYVNFSMTSEAEKAIDELNFETLRDRQMRIMWSQRDPSLRKSGVGNLFIKNLDKRILVRDLYDTFSAIGDILSCKIPTDENQQSKGYGFVHFASKEAADSAVQKLNGSILMEKKIFVGHFVPKSQRCGNSSGGPLFNNIFVKNFGEKMNESKLQEMFMEYGDITSVFCPLKEDKSSKGFGFVCFKSPHDAAKAVAAKNGVEYNGQTLFAGRAMKKAERVEHLKLAFTKKRAEKSASYSTGVNLYVKNLEDSITDEILKTEFGKHGNITSAKVMTDQVNRSKGFGFVCFSYPDEATKAVTEMNGKLLGGKPIYVALAQKKEERRVHLQNMMHQRQMAYRSAPNFSTGPMGASQGVAHHAAHVAAAGSAAAAGVPGLYNQMGPGAGGLHFPSGMFSAFQPGAASNQYMIGPYMNMQGAPGQTYPYPYLNIGRLMPPQMRPRMAAPGMRPGQGPLGGGGQQPGSMGAHQPGGMQGQGPAALYGQAAVAAAAAAQSAGPFSGYPSAMPGVMPTSAVYQQQQQQRAANYISTPQNNAAMSGRFASGAGATVPGQTGLVGAAVAGNGQRVVSGGPANVAGGNPAAGRHVPPTVQQIHYAANAKNIDSLHSLKHDSRMGAGIGLPAPAANSGMIKTEMNVYQNADGESFINKIKSLNGEEQKQALGERIFGHVVRWYPEQAGKLTGMLLEIDNRELVSFIMEEEHIGDGAAGPSEASQPSSLRKKVDAAMNVLNATGAATGASAATNPAT